jgi:hypothetical protein
VFPAIRGARVGNPEILDRPRPMLRPRPDPGRAALVPVADSAIRDDPWPAPSRRHAVTRVAPWSQSGPSGCRSRDCAFVGSARQAPTAHHTISADPTLEPYRPSNRRHRHRAHKRHKGKNRNTDQGTHAGRYVATCTPRANNGEPRGSRHKRPAPDEAPHQDPQRTLRKPTHSLPLRLRGTPKPALALQPPVTAKETRADFTSWLTEIQVFVAIEVASGGCRSRALRRAANPLADRVRVSRAGWACGLAQAWSLAAS